MPKAQPKKKLFVVKKYVFAESAAEAIRLEGRLPTDDVWVDDDWRKENMSKPDGEVGFKVPKTNGT